MGGVSCETDVELLGLEEVAGFEEVVEFDVVEGFEEVVEFDDVEGFEEVVEFDVVVVSLGVLDVSVVVEDVSVVVLDVSVVVEDVSVVVLDVSVEVLVVSSDTDDTIDCGAESTFVLSEASPQEVKIQLMDKIMAQIIAICLCIVFYSPLLCYRPIIL